jgi:hypothetical protein
MRMMQFLKITPLRTFPMAALMRPERMGILEHFAQRYPPRVEKILIPRITRAAKRNGGAARASRTSKRHALPYKLGYNATQQGGNPREPHAAHRASVPFSATVT